MARQSSASVDDAVPLKPEDLRVVLPLPHTQTACAGAAAGFLLRRIAYCAGAFAPGIQEFLFHQLTVARDGRNLDTVAAWMHAQGDQLHGLGYRISARKVMGERTSAVVDWVRAGGGHRGAVCATSLQRMHPGEAVEVEHAVGLAYDRLDPSAKDDVIVLDPWASSPEVANGKPDRRPVTNRLEYAHGTTKFATLIFYWAGWS